MRIFTVGHSRQPLTPFLAAIGAHRITLVADVRRQPFSRRQPHFSQNRLAPALEELTIRYLHLEELGGHREPRRDSRNTAIRDANLRGYADHMATREFAHGIEQLLQAAAREQTAIMCAERQWTDCHRQFIADYLTAHGHDVIHILSEDTSEPHAYTKFARVTAGELSYPSLL